MNEIICGNSLDILPMFPAEYFHACMTSIPYWGLRDYSDAVECVFGGDAGCEHEWVSLKACSSLLALQTERVSFIQPAGQLNAISDIQVGDERTRVLVEVRRQSCRRQQSGQATGKSLRARAKGDAPNLINCPIAIKYASDEVPLHFFRHNRELDSETLPGSHAKPSECFDQGDRPNIPSPYGGSFSCPLLSQGLSWCDAISDEASEFLIFADEVAHTLLPDAAIAYQETKQIGKFRCPLFEQGIVYLPLLISPPMENVGAGAGAKDLRDSFEMPSRAIGGLPTLMAGEGLASSTVRSGQSSPIHTPIICEVCGAVKCQFGLEPWPDSQVLLLPNGKIFNVGGYIEHTLEFLRAIRRVLRKDGTVWWNLGDSYFGDSPVRKRSSDQFDPTKQTVLKRSAGGTRRSAVSVGNLKPKDLVMIPFRVALAAQADGWWVRSVVIWDKPNPMPESVRDRPTTSHEYILLLTKSGESQYWTHRDENGTRTKPKADWRWVNQLRGPETDYPPHDWKEIVKCPDCDSGIITHSKMGVSWDEDCERCGGKGEFQLWKRINLWQGHDYFYDADAIRESAAPSTEGRDKYDRHEPRSAQLRHGAGYMVQPANTPTKGGRNKRTVWTIPTQPYPEAHFATFPEALVEPMILTTPTKCCAECGAGWERVTEVSGGTIGQSWHDHVDDGIQGQRVINEAKGGHGYARNTLGFRPTCSCNAGTKPAVVVDPFAGRGTVAKKAREHGRDYVVIDMNPDYIPMMKRYLAMADEEVEKQGETWVQKRLITV